MTSRLRHPRPGQVCPPPPSAIRLVRRRGWRPGWRPAIPVPRIWGTGGGVVKLADVPPPCGDGGLGGMTATYRYDVEVLHLLVSPGHAYFGRARDGAADVATADADRV